MKDREKSKDQLIAEIAELRQRVTLLDNKYDVDQAGNPLRSYQDQFRAFADVLPGAVFETDVNGVLLFANDRAFSFFGYTQMDFENGINVFDIENRGGRSRGDGDRSEFKRCQ